MDFAYGLDITGDCVLNIKGNIGFICGNFILNSGNYNDWIQIGFFNEIRSIKYENLFLQYTDENTFTYDMYYGYLRLIGIVSPKRYRFTLPVIF